MLTDKQQIELLEARCESWAELFDAFREKFPWIRTLMLERIGEGKSPTPTQFVDIVEEAIRASTRH